MIRESQCIHIDAIAFKSSGPARSRDFMQAFFRAISRIEDCATRCVIALYERGRAWRRIADAFPELEIWLVDCETCKMLRVTMGRLADWLG